MVKNTKNCICNGCGLLVNFEKNQNNNLKEEWYGNQNANKIP